MSRKKIFGKKTKYRRRFDQNELMLLFNYAFIINPEQSAIFLDRFKGYSDYHDFLICPSKFNPEMIDIEWFYNPNRSLHAEEYVFRNFKDHRDETTKKILASNNSILIKRYLSLITT